MQRFGQKSSWFYFGECTPTTNLPHGRGICLNANSIRVGYFTNGTLSDGEVFLVVTNSYRIDISVGKERFNKTNGDTIFEGKSHKPG